MCLLHAAIVRLSSLQRCGCVRERGKKVRGLQTAAVGELAPCAGILRSREKNISHVTTFAVSACVLQSPGWDDLFHRLWSRIVLQALTLLFVCVCVRRNHPALGRVALALVHAIEGWSHSVYRRVDTDFPLVAQAFDALPVLLPRDITVFCLDLSGSGRRTHFTHMCGVFLFLLCLRIQSAASHHRVPSDAFVRQSISCCHG